MVDEKFAALSPAEKRVAVAKDVIAQLDAKKIIAQAGTYVSITPAANEIVSIEPDDELQAVFAGRVCDACALGSLFICAVAKLDDCTADSVQFGQHYGADFYMRDDPYEYLGQFFDEDQLHDIERVFEGYGGWTDDDTESHLISDDENERLRVIMRNIIDSNGDFTLVPEQFEGDEA